MDKKNALSTYLDLCDSGTGFLQYNLASNVVLDFFGRTIKGRERVSQYIRYSLNQEYSQHFEDVIQCSSFEHKPAHMKTKSIADTDKIGSTELKKQEKFKSEDIDDCVTPITEKTPVLPKVTQGRKFKRTMEDSLSNQTNPALITPDQCSSKMKPLDCIPSTKRKRLTTESDILKNDCDATFYFKHKITNSTCKEKTHKEKQTEAKIETVPADCDAAFSELMYIEATGFFHSNPKTGTGRLHDANTPNFLNEGRKTRLRISYRIRRSDNNVLFYLVVYENLERNPVVRRNLYSEFQTMTVEKLVKKKPISGSKSRLRLF